jgi:hypothetical protein
MRKYDTNGLVLALAVVTMVAVSSGLRTGAAPAAAEPMIGHMVYFTLNDNSPAKVQDMVAACDKYLSKHPGEAYYAAGALAKEMKRDVSDVDWDVALHLVFQTKADHDRYATAPRHVQFIQENQAKWKKVRVFDSLIAAK